MNVRIAVSFITFNSVHKNIFKKLHASKAPNCSRAYVNFVLIAELVEAPKDFLHDLIEFESIMTIRSLDSICHRIIL